MQKKLLKKRGFWSFKHFTLIGFFAVLVLGSLDLYLLNLMPATRVTYHGPNPITMAEATKSTNMVLGSSVQRRDRRQQTPRPTSTPQTSTTTPLATVISTQTPTVTPTPTQAATSTPMPSVAPANGDYGIAAGGGLTSLSQSDLDKYFTNLQTLGVKWVRWDIDWSVIQSSNATSFDWVATDRVAAEAKKYGVNSLGIITYSPKWASSNNCSNFFQCAPSDPNAFATFAGIVATRYKDSINNWEIWNEPNFGHFLGSPANIQKYVDLLKDSYTTIKNANPNASVSTGGLAASGDEANGDTAPNTFVKGIYSLGGKGYFDELALHPYSFPASLNYIADWNSWQQMSTVRQTMINNGDSAKKIWVTEYGAPTGGPGTSHEVNQLTFTYDSDYMSEAAQNMMVSEVGTYYAQNTSWMGPVFWYSLWDNGTSTSTPENFFGLLRHDWSQKPAFATLKHIITGN